MKLFPPGFRPGEWCLELSAHELGGNPACLRSRPRALHDAGILIALDDVGFGRSSLESLVCLEPDLVKVDPRYLPGAATEAERRGPLERLVRMARAAGAEVIAESVETRAGLERFRKSNVRYGQGRLWAAPDKVPDASAGPGALA